MATATTKYWYDGPITKNKMSKEAMQGYQSWKSQKHRCINPKDKGFKYYGHKNIKLEYSSREFIGWWLLNIKYFKGNTTTCGRIDHSKNYSFDNIIMQDRTDNAVESFKRNDCARRRRDQERKTVVILCKKSGAEIAHIPSIKEVGELFGVSRSMVQMLINGKRKICKKINFELSLTD